MRRRQLAGASGAALLVGLAGAGKAAELDGELLARVDALVAHLTQERAAYVAMTAQQRREHDWRRHQAATGGTHTPQDVMVAEIARIPARTPEGARAKARAMVWDHGGDDTAQAGVALGTGLFDSLLADLTGSRCVLRAFPPPQREPWSAPDPDAAFLAHLDAYDAMQAEANAILARYSGMDDPNPEDEAKIIAIYAAQTPEAEGMIRVGCTTRHGRRRLADTLARQGYRGEDDNPRWSPEDRMEALLVRSTLAAGGVA